MPFNEIVLYFLLNASIMSSFFYILTAALVICWVFCFFVIEVHSGSIHLLLPGAFVAFLLGTVRRPTAA